MSLMLANNHLKAGRLSIALNLYNSVLGLEPNNANALLGIGKVYHAAQDLEQAKKYLLEAIQINPKLFDALIALSIICNDLGDADGAKEFMNKACNSDPMNPMVYFTAAEVAYKLGYIDQAKVFIFRAEKFSPNNEQLLVQNGRINYQSGKVDAAKLHFSRALEINSRSAHAYYGLASIGSMEVGSPQLRALESLFEERSESTENQALLAYALVKAYEKLGDYPKAFSYMLAANELKGSQNNYTLEAQEKIFTQVKEYFCKDRLPSLPTSSSSAKPIFIVGMPRSGTSLVEQILASHSKVFGAGELLKLWTLTRSFNSLNDDVYMEKLSSCSDSELTAKAEEYIAHASIHKSETDEYVTDKLPHNFLNIGVIKTLFPEAIIIHCKRNLMDVAISNFRNHFGNAHPHVHNLEHLADYLLRYLDLMEHWHDVYPGQLYDIQYEDLVHSPEPHVRAILDHCGLAYEPACLEFYNNDRVVRTVSSVQVREPLNTKSINGWKRYEEQLRPLADALGQSS